MDAARDRRAGERVENIVGARTPGRRGLDARARKSGFDQQTAAQGEAGGIGDALDLLGLIERAIAVEPPERDLRMDFGTPCL